MDVYNIFLICFCNVFDGAEDVEEVLDDKDDKTDADGDGSSSVRIPNASGTLYLSM
jgi:hypothetical protein